MSNEFKMLKSGHSLITWGLIAVVITIALQAMSVEAEKEKTLDVIPVGGSDEFYESNYVPPPRPPPRVSPPRPRPPPPQPPLPPPHHPGNSAGPTYGVGGAIPRLTDTYNGEGYQRQVKWQA